jgi:hypothetical protein
MGIFNRKKKKRSTESFKLVCGLNSLHLSFDNNISKSDVVKIAVERIASQCAKLKPRYNKKETIRQLLRNQISCLLF